MKPELEKLREALSPFNGGKDVDLTAHVDAALKSALRAVIPGRQQKGNLDKLITEGRKAFIRTLRRRDK